MFRAVVFDLWQTLVRVPEEAFAAFRLEFALALRVTPERLDELWWSGDFYRRRETGPIAPAIAALCDALGVEADVDRVLARRLALTREALVPVAGVVPTLEALRRRDILIGLVSNCTEEVPLVWYESPLAGLFDAEVFSATAGVMKPDGRIYERVLAELAVPASAALFVGDGANDELEGARRIGMTPVLVHHDGDAPLWDGLEDWDGARITSIPQVLDLVA